MAILWRIEYLLLLFGPVWAIVMRWVYGVKVVDLHLHDTYFVVSTSFVMLVVLLLLLLPFGFHLVLRWQRRRQRWPGILHVLLTLLSLLGFLLAMGMGGQVMRGQYTLDFYYWQLGASVLLFVLVQLLFFVYMLVRLWRR